MTSIDQSEDNILQMKENSNIQTHTHAHSGNTITDEFDDDEKFLKTTFMLLIRNAFIFLILQNLRSSVPSFYVKMPFLQQLVLKKKKDAHALNLHTMRI